jgi:hypothetical protein
VRQSLVPPSGELRAKASDEPTANTATTTRATPKVLLGRPLLASDPSMPPPFSGRTRRYACRFAFGKIAERLRLTAPKAEPPWAVAVTPPQVMRQLQPIGRFAHRRDAVYPCLRC